MKADLPAPLVPAKVDLRDFTYMPVDIVRLFSSDFHARSSDGEWRAGFTLWLKSFHQVPASSIPGDDISLARLAEFGRDSAGWSEVKDGALHGWTLCSDGRYYHRTVARKAIDAWIGKLLQRRSGAIGNAKRWKVEADLRSIDEDLRSAALALEALDPSSPLLSKIRVLGSRPDPQPAPNDSSPECDNSDDESQPDPDPMGNGSQTDPDPIGKPSRPDPDPIAEGSQGKGKGKGKEIIERESRERATPPPDPVDKSKPASKRGRSPKTQIPWPDDFALTSNLREYASKHGFDADWLFEKFHNKAIAKGWEYRDWAAGFRTFAQNEQTFATPGRSNGAHQDQAWRPPDV